MACPQCQSDEISPAGICLICGYRMNGEPAEPKPGPAEEIHGHSGPIQMDYSEGTANPSEKAEVPQWRQQLSQRLHEIKQKKESMAAVQQEKSPVAAVTQAKAAENLVSLQERLKKAPVRKPQAPPVPPPRQKTLEPLPEPVKRVPSVPPQSPDSQEIRNLIDSAVLRQAPQTEVPPGISFGAPPEAQRVKDGDGKLILLSRTLSGLVDLIVVLLCTGVFIIAADYFSGIVALDHASLIVFSLLFLLIFFLYSLFFLSASNQTIGMMITDLRIVGRAQKRPSVGPLFGRCCGYLLSLLFGGIGLILGIFDSECRCFHDRISGTHVVRI